MNNIYFLIKVVNVGDLELQNLWYEAKPNAAIIKIFLVLVISWGGGEIFSSTNYSVRICTFIDKSCKVCVPILFLQHWRIGKQIFHRNPLLHRSGIIDVGVAYDDSHRSNCPLSLGHHPSCFGINYGLCLDKRETYNQLFPAKNLHNLLLKLEVITNRANTPNFSHRIYFLCQSILSI